MCIDNLISKAIVELKDDLVRNHKRNSLLCEVLPLFHSNNLPINEDALRSLHRFMETNPIYLNSYDLQCSYVPCKVYEGDINNYWLSKKYDTSYQPFYPTWMLSAFALACYAKSLGYKELIDIGSGDGRIAYCAALLGLDAYGIEIDEYLVELQKSVSEATDIRYVAIRSDATRFDYGLLKLSKPIFFISGLPEMGEMLANSVLSNVDP